MLQISTSTGIVRLLDFGTYQGTCSPESWFDDYTIAEDFEQGHCDYNEKEFWDNFDFKRYMNKLVEIGSDYIESKLLPDIKKALPGILDIKVTGYYSPKEYNFRTDELLFDIIAEDDFGKQVIDIIMGLNEDELKSYQEYLKDHCTTRDGFISFVFNNIPEIVEAIRLDPTCTEIECFIDWYLDLKVMSEIEEYDWYYWLNDSGLYHSEFIAEGFEGIAHAKRELQGTVSTIALDMYREYTVEQVVQHILDTVPIPEKLEQDLGDYEYEGLVLKYVKEVFVEIENNSLELFENQ